MERQRGGIIISPIIPRSDQYTPGGICGIMPISNAISIGQNASDLTSSNRTFSMSHSIENIHRMTNMIRICKKSMVKPESILVLAFVSAFVLGCVCMCLNEVIA